MLTKKTNNYFISYIFYPLSILYQIALFIRSVLYKINFLKTKSLPCTIISIGNITTGGVGKTPTVEYLSKLLQSKGKRVGIISKGYRRNSEKTLIVTDGKTKPKTWEKFGDEPYMLAHNLDNIPIIVGSSKYETGTKMIENFNPDIIIMDDGFQHISLSRDLDIVLVNSKDTHKTHRLIPTGLLREPISNLSRADLVILTKTNIHKPSNYLINTMESVKCPIINNNIELGDILLSTNNKLYDLKNIESENIYIFSGLGDNESFEKIMKKTGAIIVGHDKYPDHYIYTSYDLKNIENNAIKRNANFIITTEKDIVKIKDYNSKVNIYAVKMKLVFKPEGILNEYIEKVL
tara:strand:+ start:544 stop:1587 length:1044 start_codon:yes stop_codon:yes gene_type:complete